MSKQLTHIRFPNESYYDKVSKFQLEDFQLINTFQYDVFGIWNDTHVFIMKEDYNKLIDNETKS
jgi:hypothetical protein